MNPGAGVAPGFFLSDVPRGTFFVLAKRPAWSFRAPCQGSETHEPRIMKCPKCCGDGWTIEPDPFSGEATQVQCEFCLASGEIPDVTGPAATANSNAARIEEERTEGRAVPQRPRGNPHD